MTLGSICHNSPAGQERWWVLLDGHMLHLELVASVFGAAHAHGLWFEDVDALLSFLFSKQNKPQKLN